MSPQRRRKLNGDHTVTQLAMSWIRESWEEAGKDEGTGLRKHKRKMERKMLWLLKPAAGRRVNEANGWMRNKLKSS